MLLIAIVSGWLFVFKLDWQFSGIVLSLLLATFAGILLYVLYLNCFTNWRNLAKLEENPTSENLSMFMRSQDNFLDSNPQHSEDDGDDVKLLQKPTDYHKISHSIDQKDMTIQNTDGLDLQTYSGYIRFNGAFSLMYAFDNLFLMVDSFLVTLLFPKEQISAQFSMVLVDFLSICFGMGNAMSITTRLGKLMVNGQVKSAKKNSLAACEIIIVIGITAGVFYWVFAEQISEFINPNDDCQSYLVYNLGIYALWVPFRLLDLVLCGICRSIKLQGVYLASQFVCHYLIHFSLEAIMFRYGYNSSTVWYAG